MTDNDRIEGAADILQRELGTDRHIALAVARQMYDIWRGRVHIADLPPGQIAQTLRERYELSPCDADNIISPLED